MGSDLRKSNGIGVFQVLENLFYLKINDQENDNFLATRGVIPCIKAG